MWLRAGLIGLVLVVPASVSRAQEAPLSLVATTIRAHGHACARALTMTHDRAVPRGSEAWLVQCDGGAGFRVVYGTGRDQPVAARVTPLVVQDE